MVVAEMNGAIVGFGCLANDEVRAVYVHPHHARKGVGSQVLKAIENMAAERKLKDLRVTSSNNAVPFYLVHGYKKTGSTEFRTPGGMKLQCVTMLKSLSS